MAEALFGIEAEYALVRPDGVFADFSNTEWTDVRRLIEPLPDFRHPELRVGDAGIRSKNWYVEGDERFDAHGRSTGLAFKGIELRTPVCRSIGECMGVLGQLRDMLVAELKAKNWSLTTIGFNPYTSHYEPSYHPWERTFHDSHVEHSLPEVSTLSFGPDLNFSHPDFDAEAVLNAVRRLTFYSPYLVPFSFSSPFVGGELWEGLSYRTLLRTGPRPAALAHLAGGGAHPLVKAADPPGQHLRIEFKAFDMVADDALLEQLFWLVYGVALAEPAVLPGAVDVPDVGLHQFVARHGLEDQAIRDGAWHLIEAASGSLACRGAEPSFDLLIEMLRSGRTPAHSLRDAYRATGKPAMHLVAGRVAG